MKIESHDRSINDLLTSGYYVIPRFQRPYSWDSENVSEFWNDAVVSEAKDYFIGSMVVYTMGDRKFGVVDGQQRLTTVMILLSVVRNAMDAAGLRNQATGLHQLIERENIENQREFILQTETSYPYFQTRVLSRDKAAVDSKILVEEERIQKAHQQFETLIRSLVDSINSDPTLTEKKKKDRIRDSLVKVRDSILSLKLIFVTLDSEDDAYVIFETLNTRGKDLALADLVKNHFSKLLKPKNRGLDPAKIKWSKIRETIEGSKVDLDTDTFLYHWWLSKREYLASNKIFKAFRKSVEVGNASNTLDDLAKDAEYYRAINEPDYWRWDKSANEAKLSLKALQLFRVRQQVPCALALFRAYEDKRIKQAQLISALGDIEKFHFLFTAITSQRSSGGISGMYAALARQIAAVGNAQKATPIIVELRAKLKERVPSKDEFLALFPELLYTNTLSKQRGLVKYVLSRLAREQGHAFTADMDDLTIEHLVSQSEIGKNGWDEETIGQVGNLLLVTSEVNAKLKNKSFAEKMTILKTAKCDDLLPSYIRRSKVITPALVRRRTEELGNLAYTKAWKI
jgi:uncharacterized protein with ParB-like and HNH nuclease domain